MTELGKRLIEAREEKGMSLEDLQTVTKIQKRYLLAIEQGNYDIIPGKFYVRAFIKQYAEAVGLNPEQLFEEFRKDVPSTYNDEVSDKLSNIKPQRELPKPASKVLELLPTILIIGGVLVVIAIIYVIVQAVNHDSGQKNNQTAPQQSESKYEVSEDSSLAKDQKKKEKAAKEKEEREKAAAAKKREQQQLALQKQQEEKKRKEVEEKKKQEEKPVRVVQHTVGPEENLYRISMKYYKSRSGEEKIKAYNHLNGNSVYSGQVLNIPLEN
ncbi:helix-turn-helix domain-containing protein [Bacillus pumilus]|uniref:helix-turn-helix domain-containing protein n=2 Tax=Bacillus pumilus TaxID=1408 RepID=UPI002FFE40EE